MGRGYRHTQHDLSLIHIYYPIRLLTILKYLKRKGINMNYADIDVYVDNLIQKMDGVRKVGRGLYIIKE